MQLGILRTKIILPLLLLLLLDCNRKNDLNNPITITIKVIDSKTKQSRINKFDTIEVRKEGLGYLGKTFDKVGEYITDSTGIVQITIIPKEGYRFMASGQNVYGSANFTKAFTKKILRNNEQVIIEVTSINN
ncbi:hypothetical protein [uncultured Chryseobacterium sp.]|uniref:hypothetical protein n=1 Tax=uncultured Chryseobacterium sp. TaxID=259322 RepID=UPI0037478DD2